MHKIGILFEPNSEATHRSEINVFEEYCITKFQEQDRPSTMSVYFLIKKFSNSALS